MVKEELKLLKTLDKAVRQESVREVPDENWVVVSFHAVPAEELIEERPDSTDEKMTQQRKYLAE